MNLNQCGLSSRQVCIDDLVAVFRVQVISFQNCDDVEAVNKL